MAAHCAGVTTSAPRPRVAACVCSFTVTVSANVVERISTLPLSACDDFAPPTTISAAASAATTSTTKTARERRTMRATACSSVGVTGEAQKVPAPATRASESAENLSADDEIDHATGHHDDRPDGRAREQLHDARVGASGGLVVGLRRARGHSDLAPDLAVDL